jgi:undecaprenyl-diphosphatase
VVPVWLQALVLGVVQGLTEFIPVSSKSHLVLVPYLLGWQEPGLAFIVALHLGTLAAVLCYFRRELLTMAAALTGHADPAQGRLYRRLALLLVLANVPVMIIGLLFEQRIEAVFASPGTTAGLLFVTAALLVTGEKIRDCRVAKAPIPGSAAARWSVGDPLSGVGTTTVTATATRVCSLPVGQDEQDPAGATLAELSVRHALIVGLVQVIALLPGVSRSGTTITGGLASGLTREAATRFSFLLSIPAIAGASVLTLGDLAQPSRYRALDIALGTFAAFVAGYLAIRWLVSLVAHDRLTGFAWYCVAAAVIGLLGYFALG